MTVRKSTYRSIRSLQRDNARCRACVEAGYPLESWPVRAPYAGQRAYLYGQAPGIVEGEERLPWRGRAGQTLRRWLRLDGDALYETLLLRIRHPLLSRPRAVRPRRPHADAARAAALLVLARLGARAAPPGADRHRRRPRRQPPARDLEPERLHRQELRAGGAAAGAIVIPLPHPSGASAWLNDPANRARLGKALTHVRRELARVAVAER